MKTSVRLQPGDIDLCDPDVFVEHSGPPHAYLQMLRREAPVHWNPAPQAPKTALPLASGFHVITRYEDLKYISRTPKLFSSTLGTPFLMDVREPAVLAEMQTQLLAMDPPRHVKHRRLVQRGFTPNMVQRLEPVIRGHAKQIVDRVAARGACEFVEDLACELPLVLLCELLGVPARDRKKVFHWSNRMVGTDDPDMAVGAEDARRAEIEMWMYCDQLAEQKLANPDDTLISKYLHGEVDGEKISKVELNKFFVLLAVAGNETTRNTTSHFMRLMFEHPEQYELVKSDVSRYLPDAIEEVLRFAPPVVQFCRTATEDTELRDTKIRKGDKVYLSYPSANRDEDIFEDSMTFDITRPRQENHHLAFGIGEHFCLGAGLARMQLQSILGEVLTRLPDMELAGPVEFQRSNFIHGIKKMLVTYQRKWLASGAKRRKPALSATQ